MPEGSGLGGDHCDVSRVSTSVPLTVVAVGTTGSVSDTSAILPRTEASPRSAT